MLSVALLIALQVSQPWPLLYLISPPPRGHNSIVFNLLSYTQAGCFFGDRYFYRGRAPVFLCAVMAAVLLAVMALHKLIYYFNGIGNTDCDTFRIVTVSQLSQLVSLLHAVSNLATHSSLLLCLVFAFCVAIGLAGTLSR